MTGQAVPIHPLYSTGLLVSGTLVEGSDFALSTDIPDLSGYATESYVDSAIAAIPDGVTDHGALSGLGDDDHTQYALADGSRGAFIPLATSVANRLTKRNGTTGLIQDTGITVDASNNVTGVVDITPSGVIKLAGSSASPSITNAVVGAGLWWISNSLIFASASQDKFAFDNNSFLLRSNGEIGWRDGNILGSTTDTKIKRASANTVGVYQADGTTLGNITAGTATFSSSVNASSLTLTNSGANNSLTLTNGTQSTVLFMHSAGSTQYWNFGVNTPLYIYGSSDSGWVNLIHTEGFTVGNSSTGTRRGYWFDTGDGSGDIGFTRVDADTIKIRSRTSDVAKNLTAGAATFSGNIVTSGGITNSGSLISGGGSFAVTAGFNALVWSGAKIGWASGGSVTGASTPDTHFARISADAIGAYKANGTTPADFTAGAATFSGLTTVNAKLNAGGATFSVDPGTGHSKVYNNGCFGFTASATADTSVEMRMVRASSNVFGFYTGTSGTTGAGITAGAATFSGLGRLGIYTVATLPSAAANPYCEANVSDALAPVIGSTVVTGGAVKASVRSNGTDWTVTGI